MSAEQWPPPVLRDLRRRVGEHLSVERQGAGMSGASVFRVRGLGDASAIVKASPRGAESRFYETAAPRLRTAGIPIPEVHCVVEADGMHWLVMEDVPGQFVAPAREVWRPEPEIVAVLARLHRATRGWELPFPPSEASTWTDAMTRAARGYLAPSAVREVAPVLNSFQEASTSLAQPWCWISGDTSPPNWGRRTDGGLALYDWELFRQGTPAGDLAPAVPGLAEPWQYSAMASAYIEAWDRDGSPRLPWGAADLARETAIAKVTTVVMLLHSQASGQADVPGDYIAGVVREFPAWLARMGAFALPAEQAGQASGEHRPVALRAAGRYGCARSGR